MKKVLKGKAIQERVISCKSNRSLGGDSVSTRKGLLQAQVTSSKDQSLHVPSVLPLVSMSLWAEQGDEMGGCAQGSRGLSPATKHP